ASGRAISAGWAWPTRSRTRSFVSRGSRAAPAWTAPSRRRSRSHASDASAGAASSSSRPASGPRGATGHGTTTISGGSWPPRRRCARERTTWCSGGRSATPRTRSARHARSWPRWRAASSWRAPGRGCGADAAAEPARDLLDAPVDDVPADLPAVHLEPLGGGARSRGEDVLLPVEEDRPVRPLDHVLELEAEGREARERLAVERADRLPASQRAVAPRYERENGRTDEHGIRRV